VIIYMEEDHLMMDMLLLPVPWLSKLLKFKM
jgi:hypothetical protein